MINQYKLDLYDPMHRIKSTEYHDTERLAHASGTSWKLLTPGNFYRITDTHEHSCKPCRRVSIAATCYKPLTIVYQYGNSGTAISSRHRVIQNPTEQQLQTALKAQVALRSRNAGR